MVRDLDLIETAEFWRSAPEIERGEVRTQDIATEVFVFPAAAHSEKSGSFTNTERRVQWHERAVDPVGDVTSDLWWIHDLGARIKRRLAARDDARDASLRALVWDYTTPGAAEDPDPEAVLREMSGFHEADGRPLAGPGELRDDGGTRCGLWIYAGLIDTHGNHARSRTPAAPGDPLGHDWGTRRIRPLTVGGRRCHHVAASYHYGRKGIVTGDPLNELFALSGEPNTTIQGSKVTSVAVVKGRSVSGRNVVTSGPLVPDFPPRADVRRDLPQVGDHVRGPHGCVGPAGRAHGLEEEDA